MRIIFILDEGACKALRKEPLRWGSPRKVRVICHDMMDPGLGTPEGNRIMEGEVTGRVGTDELDLVQGALRLVLAVLDPHQGQLFISPILGWYA